MARLTPGNFHEALKGLSADLDRKGAKDTTYQVKVFKALRGAFTVPAAALAALSNGNYGNPMAQAKGMVNDPLFDKLHIARLRGITLGSLLLIDERNKALARALALDDIHEGFGLVFPVEHHGDWILHNLGAPEGNGPGCARIVIQSRKTSLRDVWAEPLKQFIDNLKGGADHERT